ncbi:hypothetical protein BC834DRAFT_501356 [Gloeopeniophorella convolvens]|nr:hypothetical protein BC834DRAFT_501356 [Gloeopeniophorella convolvens]
MPSYGRALVPRTLAVLLRGVLASPMRLAGFAMGCLRNWGNQHRWKWVAESRWPWASHRLMCVIAGPSGDVAQVMSAALLLDRNAYCGIRTLQSL